MLAVYGTTLAALSLCSCPPSTSSLFLRSVLTSYSRTLRVSMSTGVNIPTNSSQPIGNQVIVICGPTSVGKSAVASRLCATLPSEMLLADAVQVYRHLDIGSNKPRPEEMVSVPHHLVDICCSRKKLRGEGEFCFSGC